jgi:excisionase family DNA binding protein
MLQAARELASGNAIAILPLNKDLTTQEAADILNVSRPYLIKLLEQGDIPYVKTGTHRRVRLSDVLTYKHVRDAERRRALAKLTQLSQDMGIYDA